MPTTVQAWQSSQLGWRQINGGSPHKPAVGSQLSLLSVQQSFPSTSLYMINCFHF